MKVFDTSRLNEGVVKWNYITWPGKGYMPVEYFQPNSAWHISLNEDYFNLKDLTKISVKLRNTKSNQVWNFNSKMNNPANNQNYFNVEPTRYGGSMAITFRPEMNQSIQPRETYEVTVTGLASGEKSKKEEIKYTVTFFKL